MSFVCLNKSTLRDMPNGLPHQLERLGDVVVVKKSSYPYRLEAGKYTRADCVIAHVRPHVTRDMLLEWLLTNERFSWLTVSSSPHNVFDLDEDTPHLYEVCIQEPCREESWIQTGDELIAALLRNTDWVSQAHFKGAFNSTLFSLEDY